MGVVCCSGGKVWGTRLSSTSWTENPQDGNASIPGLDAGTVTFVTMLAGPKEGVSFAVWSDADAGEGGRGSGGSNGASYVGQHRWRDGTIIEIQAETKDGVAGSITIDGNSFDIADRPLFLISTQEDRVTIEQIPYDLQSFSGDADALRELATTHESISGFFRRLR